MVAFAFLPPANEVWGKVMFLHLYVILFMGGRYVSQHAMGQGVYPSMQWGRGCLPKGMSTTPPPTETATETDGMHPTGIPSCCPKILERWQDL